MIKVASYCRVSTDKEDQANSFETQKRYFREYIQNHPDWELYEIYADEGITGTTTKKRTQFKRMINDAYEGKFQMIITKEVSRFSRNILDTIAYTRELKAIGIGVFFATDRINTLEPEAEMLLSYLASMAQEESRRTSARVVWGQTRQMERGVVFGQSLLGYDLKDGILSINPEGAEIVRLIFHKYAVEQVSTAEIARMLACKGYYTYRGSAKWKASAVIKILNNEKYVGDLIQKKTYTPDFLTHAKRSNKGEVTLVTIENHHPPIISRERWSCGTAVSEGAQSCGIGKLIRDDDAMQMLKTAIRNLPIDRKSIINNVTALALEAIQAGEIGSTDDLQRLQFEIDRVHQKKEAVMDSYFSGEISKEDMQIMNRKYDRQIEDLYQRREEATLRQRENRDSKTLGTIIQAEVTGILNGEIESEVFYKTMLNSLTVFKDRHMELQLNLVPQVFQFI